MVKKEVIVKIITGLHARPAANLVKLANTFNSNITITKAAQVINAKDIWEVLNGGIDSGDKIILTCDGDDEALALDKISTFMNDEEES